MDRYRSGHNGPDSKSGSRASGSWVRIPPYPPKESSKLKGLLDFPFSRILIFPNSCVRTAYFLVENRVQIRFCYLALYSAFHNTTRMPCNRFSTSISPSRRTLVRRDGGIFQRTSQPFAGGDLASHFSYQAVDKALTFHFLRATLELPTGQYWPRGNICLGGSLCRKLKKKR